MRILEKGGNTYGASQALDLQAQGHAVDESGLTLHELGLPPNSSGNHRHHHQPPRTHELSGILNSCPILQVRKPLRDGENLAHVLRPLQEAAPGFHYRFS